MNQRRGELSSFYEIQDSAHNIKPLRHFQNYHIGWTSLRSDNNSAGPQCLVASVLSTAEKDSYLVDSANSHTLQDRYSRADLLDKNRCSVERV
jgi:hypothetical protein